MPIVSCRNCQKPFGKTAAQITRFPRHFCCRSCAAQVNNRLAPKRSKAGECKTCGAPISACRTYCPVCWATPSVRREMPIVKTCPRCDQNKAHKSYYFKDKTRGVRQSFCKVCVDAYSIRRWKLRKVEAVKYMGGCCQDCGGVFHPNVYDFHHLRDEDFVWDQLRLRFWEQVKYELDK